MRQLKKIGLILLMMMLLFQVAPVSTSAELSVHGTITGGGWTIPDGSSVCFTPWSGGQCIPATITNGAFDLSLPEDASMTYRLTGLNKLRGDGPATDWIDLNLLDYQITVANGRVSGPLDIVIPDQPVQGTVMWEQGGSGLTSGSVFIMRIDRVSMTYGINVTNGAFSTYLQDGTYRISSYMDYNTGQGGSLPVTTFAVVNGVPDRPDATHFIIHASNVQGTVQSETVSGPVDVNNGDIHINQANNPSLWYHASIRQGKFGMYLQDGDYTVTGVNDNDTHLYTPIKQAFSVVKGILQNPNDLVLLVKGVNITGSVSKLVNGELLPMGNGNIGIYSPTLNQGFGINVTDGQFTTYLADGTYNVNNYYDFTTDSSISMQLTFEVENGQLKGMDRLVLVAKPNNVFGTLQMNTENGLVDITKADLQISQIGGMGFNASVKLGEFGVYLPDGTYQVTGYRDARTDIQTPLMRTFTVENGVLKDAEKLDLVVQQNNVTGTLERQTAQGQSPVSDVFLNLHQIGGNGFSVSVKNGNFGLYLADGTYQVSGYWDPNKQEQVSVGGSFTVVNGQLSDPNGLHLLVHMSNLSGTLRKVVDTGVVPVTRAQINIRNTSGNMNTNVTVKNGQFSIYLEDGNYSIDGFWDEVRQEYVPVNQKLTVKGGVLVTPGGLDVILQLPNVSGTLKSLTGTWVNNVNLNMYRQGGDGFSATVKDGKFSVYLQDGTYQVTGYWENMSQKHTSVLATFVVENGRVTADTLAALQLVVKNTNVSGTLKTQTGPSTYTAVQSGWINIHSQQGNVGTSTSIKDGAFALYLPDGTYAVDGYWNNATQQHIPIRGKFSVVNGHVTRMKDTQFIIQTSNVKGTIQFMTDSGTLPVQEGMLNLHAVIGGNGFSVSVKAGAYNLYLPDGTYQVDGVWNQQTQSYKSIAKLLTVLNGQVVGTDAADFTIGADNIFGTVEKAMDHTYIPVQQGWVNLHLVDSQTGMGTQIQNGQFGMFVADGQYQIDGYWDNELQIYTSMDAQFTVSQGAVTDPDALHLKIQTANVSGTLKKGTSNIRGAWVNLRDTATGRGYGANVRGGVFKLYLPDGSYQVDGYWDESNQVYVPLVQAFDVQNGSLVGASSLALVSAAANVTGTLRDSADQAISDVWLNLTSSAGDPITVYVSNGEYGLYLADGTYSIDGYWDDVNQMYVALFGTFTVQSGAVTGDTASAVQIAVQAANVEGVLLDANQQPLTDVWVVLSHLDANQEVVQSVNVLVKNGRYQIGLADGMYRVDGYWAKANVRFVEDGRTFEVQQGRVVNPTTELYSL